MKLQEEILNKLKTDNVFVTKLSVELGLAYPTVKSWVYRDSKKLLEYPFLSVLAKMLNKDVCNIIIE